jgi:hypothetical protein
MGRYRQIALVLFALVGSSACGLLPGSQPAATAVPPTAAAPTVAVSPVPTKPAAAPAASPSAVAKPTATAASSSAVEKVWVGNTDGEGVYLRKTPVMADRIKAYPDKTVLVIIDADVDGDGQSWHHVRAPDAVEGYVPVQYTVTTEP